jgi:putative copper export protein
LWGAAPTLAFAGILLPFVRRKRLKTVLGVAALLVLALAGVGCGSSSNSKVVHQGVYALNLTASAGTGSTAKTVSLVVTITK